MTTDLGTDLQESLFSLDETSADGGTPPGFRLNRLELLNWGTFHQGVRTFRLDGANSLLTGDIGSGKSTVVDAITTLLLPAHKIEYNKAAGAQKKERSLMSYVRGFHKSARSAGGEYSKPVPLRATGQLTVVLGVFHNAVLGKWVTLGITLWATQEAGQPNRFYSLAEADQTIAADFSNFGQDPMKLKKKLRAAGVSVHDAFDPYSAAFKRQFGISGNQAMELFHRTVSMKQVENITSFVRGNMLEEDDVAARITNLIHHFDDLKKAHDAVLRAKDQIALLTPIKEGAALHAGLTADDELARKQRDQLHPWFTDRKLQLSLEHQAELERTGVRLQEDWTRLNGEVKQLRRDLAGVDEDIRTNGGGRLAAIDAELAALAAKSAEQRQRFEAYSDAAAELGLQAPEDRVLFDANRARLATVEQELADRSNVLHEERTTLSIRQAELTSKSAEIKAELTSLQARRNLIPLPQLDIRRRLCEGTGITDSDLPFVGELLKVREGEAAWEGAAERTLHGFALSLLVPAEHYSAVSSWVDANNLRGRLVYLRIGESYAPGAAEPGTLAAKIAIKQGTPFRDFLQDELSSRFDYFCCENLADFRRYPKALTPNGQLKGGRGRHEKDDRKDLADRRNYVLGWDNHDKIAGFRADLDEVQGTLKVVAGQLERVNIKLGSLGRHNQQLGTVRSVTEFGEISWQATARSIEDLKAEKRALETTSDVLQQLMAKQQQVTKELDRLEEKAGKLRERLGANEKDARDIAEAIEECRAILVDTPVTDDAGMLAAVGRLTSTTLGDKPLTYKNTATVESAVRNILTDTIDALSKRIARAAESTVTKMADFRNKYPNETTDVDASLEAAADYNRLLEQLEGNDLPRFETQFKDLLNQNTIREVVAFNAFLDSRRQNIIDRIGEINQSLAGIPYNTGRHIQLEHQATADQDVREFGSDLRACSEGTIGGTDQYSEQKYLQVERLIDRFRGREGLTDLDRKWTAKVTDVRNWFTFSASEKWTETGEEYEHFTDSGGKSGGQKEKLAYTILAAALAFQFGLGSGKGAGRNAGNGRSFRFVVIDEAFGRGSDESARYGLELFERMQLQLLIVTPLQKIHVIEPFVSHVGFVANINGDDSQLRNLTIQEYREEKDRRGH
ncbi:ATP-binding protein [Pseudarthrobacter sp. NIBRBAC000502771]|uniref:ATP-binding protein n=1 Tax=Pseudarthrobacter sp. NIBRBAC000502771 TaxID=2590774 RepID=UPI001130F9DF|nr:ATP-binding protein [Pseudarthrobacter sp. NIBRBAC000502771]QDG64412.1 ATP-dependent exonuclease SbcCD, C subunit-like protein [Pseudarthrobacter sp. NIBRBAC000502771]